MQIAWEAIEKGQVEKDIRSAEEDSFSDDDDVRGENDLIGPAGALSSPLISLAAESALGVSVTPRPSPTRTNSLSDEDGSGANTDAGAGAGAGAGADLRRRKKGVE